MKILQVTRGLRKAGGVSTFVRELSDELFKTGHDIAIAMNRPKTENWMPPTCSEPVLALREALSRDKRWDIVHIHGIWDAECRVAARWAIRKDIPLVWSPHGMLAPWAFSYHWYRKMLPWHLYLKRLLRNASAFHATADMEAVWIHEAGFDNPIEIVPLGTHLPDMAFLEDNKRTLTRKRVLFVGRIHPVKGLENLVRAWAMCDTHGWELRLVGPDNNHYGGCLRQLAAELGCADNVSFVGALFGNDLTVEFCTSECLVLPSFTENFGGVVIDALASGTPVIASKFTPWTELEGKKSPPDSDGGEMVGQCGWWVGNEPAALAAALSNMMSLSDSERVAMGLSGRDLVSRKYTWEAVGKRMERVYSQLVDRRR